MSGGITGQEHAQEKSCDERDKNTEEGRGSLHYSNKELGRVGHPCETQPLPRTGIDLIHGW